MANKMTELLNKIERRLGVMAINLPERISKNTWTNDVITADTLEVFSRYYPHKVRVFLDHSMMKNGYFIIDEDLIDNTKILGVRDIGWDQFSEGASSSYLQTGNGYGYYDFLNSSYSLEDILMVQSRADQTSLFNNGIYPEFKPPNAIKLVSVTGANLSAITNRIPIDVFVVHASNLMTLSPTKMSTFENLATADVASYLFEYLKFYDNLDTVFGNVDLKLQSLENQASKREDIIQILEASYVSPGNDNQPMMFTV